MGYYFDYLEFDKDIDRHEEKVKIDEVHEFIRKGIEEDDEPPDEDSIIEGLGYSDDDWELVRKAYELYWKG